MKLSHKSKVRLGVGVGAFALIIGLMFGLSSLLTHFASMQTSSKVVRTIAELGYTFDGDDYPDEGDGYYSTQLVQLSSTSFDADSFQSLDLDISSGAVEVKLTGDASVHVTERGHVANAVQPVKAATQNLAEVKGSTLRINPFDGDDDRATDRMVTIELPRELAENMMGINASIDSGDLTVTGVAGHDLDLTLDSGDVEFRGTVTDALNVEAASGGATFELNQAPAKSLDARVGAGDVEIAVPHGTGFKAVLTIGSGEFDTDFLSDDIDDAVSNLEFENGDGSAAYRFDVGSGDMSLDAE